MPNFMTSVGYKSDIMYRSNHSEVFVVLVPT